MFFNVSQKVDDNIYHPAEALLGLKMKLEQVTTNLNSTEESSCIELNQDRLGGRRDAGGRQPRVPTPARHLVEVVRIRLHLFIKDSHSFFSSTSFTRTAHFYLLQQTALLGFYFLTP